MRTVIYIQTHEISGSSLFSKLIAAVHILLQIFRLSCSNRRHESAYSADYFEFMGHGNPEHESISDEQ